MATRKKIHKRNKSLLGGAFSREPGFRKKKPPKKPESHPKVEIYEVPPHLRAPGINLSNISQLSPNYNNKLQQSHSDIINHLSTKGANGTYRFDPLNKKYIRMYKNYKTKYDALNSSQKSMLHDIVANKISQNEIFKYLTEPGKQSNFGPRSQRISSVNETKNINFLKANFGDKGGQLLHKHFKNLTDDQIYEIIKKVKQPTEQLTTQNTSPPPPPLPPRRYTERLTTQNTSQPELPKITRDMSINNLQRILQKYGNINSRNVGVNQLLSNARTALAIL
jgi:hypothetical protein